jgi:hypothetical protein
MPRLSTAARSLVLLQGQAPLEPSADLTGAEREVFRATVKAVKAEHFAPEDLPLLAAYSAAVVQQKAIVAELGKASGEDVDRLRAAMSRAAGDLVKLARALRLGPMARDDSRRRRGTVRPTGPRPWDYAKQA